MNNPINNICVTCSGEKRVYSQAGNMEIDCPDCMGYFPVNHVYHKFGFYDDKYTERLNALYARRIIRLPWYLFWKKQQPIQGLPSPYRGYRWENDSEHKARISSLYDSNWTLSLRGSSITAIRNALSHKDPSP